MLKIFRRVQILLPLWDTKTAEGLNYVILNGEVVVENAVFNGKKCGKVILK